MDIIWLVVWFLLFDGFKGVNSWDVQQEGYIFFGEFGYGVFYVFFWFFGSEYMEEDIVILGINGEWCCVIF